MTPDGTPVALSPDAKKLLADATPSTAGVESFTAANLESVKGELENEQRFESVDVAKALDELKEISESTNVMEASD